MSETRDNVTQIDAGRRLSEAMRAAKNAAADRSDVVVEMRDAEKMRLELLAAELEPVIADVPAESELFDFAVSSGLQPRFWIDAVSHVAMGRDKRNYRFVKDTRNGRVVLAETPDIRAAADAVTRYVAERVIDRERLLEGGEPVSYRKAPDSDQPAVAGSDDPAPVTGTGLSLVSQSGSGADVASTPAQQSGGWSVFFWSLAIFLFGAAFGYSVMATQLWNDLRAATGL